MSAKRPGRMPHHSGSVHWNGPIRESAFGPTYLDRPNEVSESHRGQRFRVIEDLVIRPSADLGALASEVLQPIPHADPRSPLFRLAMRGLGGGTSRTAESDLFSHLLALRR